MSEINLLQETIDMLGEHGKTIYDIKWFGCDEFAIPENQFQELFDVNYDNGFGAQEIAMDLIVCGDDWWLEREEYDGAENWVFKTMPTKPKKERRVKTVSDGLWSAVSDLNLEDEEDEE